MAYKATEQQQAVIDGAVRGESFCVQALAGTGKTSTIINAARSHSANGGTGLVLVFNKENAVQLSARLPSGFTARTLHSLAYQHTGAPRRASLSTGLVRGYEIARSMRIGGWSGTRSKMSGPQLCSVARRTITNMSHTTDAGPGPHHVPNVEGIAHEDLKAFKNTVSSIASRILERAMRPAQILYRIDHDWYVWEWYQNAMNATGAPPSLIRGGERQIFFLDEAQDTTPIEQAIFSAQWPRVAVGDSCQAIYAFRVGPKGDALARYAAEGAPVLPLTQTFRFGEAIARGSDRWLARLGTDLRIVACDKPGRVGPVDRSEPFVTLHRTNAGVIGSVIADIAAGHRTAMFKNGSGMRALAAGLKTLHDGRKTEHPELVAFQSWSDLVEYVTGPDCGDPALRTLVDMCQQHGPGAIVDTLKRCVEWEDAERGHGTIHSFKGMEAPQVLLGSDCREESVLKRSQGDTAARRQYERLMYVAVTRGTSVVDSSAIDNPMEAT